MDFSVLSWLNKLMKLFFADAARNFWPRFLFLDPRQRSEVGGVVALYSTQRLDFMDKGLRFPVATIGKV